jgi:glutathione S-transferase
MMTGSTQVHHALDARGRRKDSVARKNLSGESFRGPHSSERQVDGHEASCGCAVRDLHYGARIMKLHTFIGSPNGRKAEAVIDHLGLDVEIEYHDLLAGELQTPSYLALNPNAKVPTLVDGDFVLWESNAILQYLADKAGDAALFPRDMQKRADILRWQCWELAHFNRAFGTLAFETVAKPKLRLGSTDEGLVATAQTDLARYAPVLEVHLGRRRYLVTDAITIADYAVITFESYREAVPFGWSAFPNINAYFDRVAANDSWIRTAPANIAARARRPKVA